MKVALLTYSTRPRGGVVHTLALAEALTDLGVAVHVWTLARGGDSGFFREVSQAVGIRAVPFRDVEGEDVGARIARSIEVLAKGFEPHRGEYDVVHAQDCISANAAMPCVRTVHHLETFTTPQLVSCHERAVVKPIAHVCVSASVAAEVRAGWGIEPTVIPNGVDAGRFAAGAEDSVGRAVWRARLGRYVLALGGIEPRKASIDLLEAFNLLRSSSPAHADVRLVFGGGETLFDYRCYRDSFDARARELGIEPAIVGVLSEAELPSLVAEARALAMVSTKEGFGLAAMEALAAGVPVIARDLPVLREVFDDAVAYGVDVPSIAQELGRVLDCPPPVESGRRLAASFTWERAAHAHIDFYRRLAG